MYLTNTWYVVAQSQAILHTLTAHTVLDEHIVLFRDSKNNVAALEDACPHRKLPLSMGTLIGDTVQCGYHGLTFDRTGQCVSAPTQGKIPVNAKVRRYPVVEKYNLVWVWIGDPEHADESQILHIPDYDNPNWVLTDGGMLQVKCNYLYLVDNLLDPSHVAWVHTSSFASPGTEDTPLEISETDNGVVVSRWIRGVEPPPYYADKIGFSGAADRLQHYEVILPCIAINMGIYTPAADAGGENKELPVDAYRMRSYHFMTPIDETTTRYHWFQHYNTDIDNEAVRQQLNEGARVAFEEDRVILEAVQKGMDNMTSRNIDLRLDAGARLFRKKLAQEIARQCV